MCISICIAAKYVTTKIFDLNGGKICSFMRILIAREVMIGIVHNRERGTNHGNTSNGPRRDLRRIYPESGRYQGFRAVL